MKATSCARVTTTRAVLGRLCNVTRHLQTTASSSLACITRTAEIVACTALLKASEGKRKENTTAFLKQRCAQYITTATATGKIVPAKSKALYLIQDRDRWRALVDMTMSLRVPSKVKNFLPSWATISFSIITLLYGVIVHVKVKSLRTVKSSYTFF
jgi:hypothetical protein